MSIHLSHWPKDLLERVTQPGLNSQFSVPPLKLRAQEPGQPGSLRASPGQDTAVSASMAPHGQLCCVSREAIALLPQLP